MEKEKRGNQPEDHIQAQLSGHDAQAEGNARSFGVVIVAAGSGKRMKSKQKKQFIELAGKPVFIHTIERFEEVAQVDKIVIVTAAPDVDYVMDQCKAYGLTKVCAVVSGGAERQQSVYEGLAALKEQAVQYVLVHDAVRPFVDPEMIVKCCEATVQYGAAVLAVPVKDTIKIVNTETGLIETTPERDKLWAVQTPQGFELEMLMRAHEQAESDGITGTDDAMLIEQIGGSVRIVESDYDNIKLTTPEDLTWAEYWLSKQVGRKPEGF